MRKSQGEHRSRASRRPRPRTTVPKRAPQKRGRGLNLARLRRPDPHFDLRHQLESFESRKEARAEDRKRIKRLRKWQQFSDNQIHLGRRRKAVIRGFDPRKADTLIRSLSKAQQVRQLAVTFASKAYMRQYRRGFCASVLKLLDGVPDRDVRLYTIIPPAWRTRGDQLATVEPKRLLEQFRTQLNRAGLAGLMGWLIAFVHGEYDGTYDVFTPHLHVLVVGTKAQAVENLRKQKAYQPSQFVLRPIVARRLKDRPRQVSYYLAQSFWPVKSTITINGREVRVRERRRIPEPRHAEFLMWLDRQSFADLVWLHGCAIKNGKLVPLQPQGHRIR